jgi:sugar lactone lactonase YvrE
MADATLRIDARARLGEGALWNPREQRLYWVDIEGRLLHVHDPATGEDRSFPTGERVGTVVPREGGGVLVALQNGIHALDTRTGGMKLVVNPLTDRDVRFNDGKCDPSGRLWVGTMELSQKPGAAVLYRLDGDGRIQEVLQGVTISNGLAWSLDRRTLYYIDTPTRAVQAFDYDDRTGALRNGRVVIRVPPGEGDPDGMTVDAEGKLWTALWGGGAVARWDPETGKLLQKVHVPAPHTTSCAFGGAGLDTLYITTAREGLSEEHLRQYPASGGVFAATPGVRGVPAFFYRGHL